MALSFRTLTEVLTFALAAFAALDLVRHRTVERLEIFAFFGAFAIGSWFSIDMTIPAFLMATIALTALPYLTLRLADHFRPVPRVILGLALGGMVYCWLLNAWYSIFVFRFEGTVATQPSPHPIHAALQGLYVVGAFGYAAALFVPASFATSGVTAWRARVAAAGSAALALGLATVVTLVMTNPTEAGLPGWTNATQDALFLAAGVAAVCYFAAFATPPWGRQLWMLGELHRFLKQIAATSVGEQREGSLASLTAAAERATGGTATVTSPDAGARPSKTTLAVPIETGGRRFGDLRVSFRRPPLFPGDDTAMLRLMADQTAIALANDELLRERRELDERERARSRAEMDRIEQELEVARRIQLSLLPRATPVRPGWSITSFYRPAREVGGDLYDFFTLPDGSLAIVIGDASGLGMAAALVMATARSEVRSAGATTSSPGEMLARANASLLDGMPPSTFVTCMVVALDTTTGRARYANAGHDLAYASQRGQARDLRARGMPLGLMAEQSYEEMETTIGPAETVLLYTDGIVEAHGPDGVSMFSFGRLRDLVARSNGDPTALVMSELAAFTGPAWEQEDDITTVSIQRAS